MPYVSDAQRRYFNANRERLEAEGVDVDEWNEASRGMDLPERARKKKNLAKVVFFTGLFKALRRKDQVNYREGSKSTRCGNCAHYRLHPPDFESGACTKVVGLIGEDDLCDLWAKRSMQKAHDVSDEPRDEHGRWAREPWHMTRSEFASALKPRTGANGTVKYFLGNSYDPNTMTLYASVESALRDHKYEVEDAAASGKPVPANVLADYPGVKIVPKKPKPLAKSQTTECPMCEPGGGEEPGNCRYCGGAGKIGLNATTLRKSVDILPALRQIEQRDIKPKSMPGYGDLWWNTSDGEVWWNGGDGDTFEQADIDAIKSKITALPGVRKVTYESECLPFSHYSEEGKAKWQRVCPRPMKKAIVLNRRTGMSYGQAGRVHESIGSGIKNLVDRIPFVHMGTKRRYAQNAAAIREQHGIPHTIQAAHAAFRQAKVSGTTRRTENGIYHDIRPTSGVRATTRAVVGALRSQGHTVLGVHRHPEGGNMVRFHTGHGVLHYARIPRAPIVHSPEMPKAPAVPKEAAGPLSAAEHTEYRDLAVKAASGRLRPQHEARLNILATRHARAGGHVMA